MMPICWGDWEGEAMFSTLIEAKQCIGRCGWMKMKGRDVYHCDIDLHDNSDLKHVGMRTCGLKKRIVLLPTDKYQVQVVNTRKGAPNVHGEHSLNFNPRYAGKKAVDKIAGGTIGLRGMWTYSNIF